MPLDLFCVYFIDAHYRNDALYHMLMFLLASVNDDILNNHSPEHLIQREFHILHLYMHANIGHGDLSVMGLFYQNKQQHARS